MNTIVRPEPNENNVQEFCSRILPKVLHTLLLTSHDSNHHDGFPMLEGLVSWATVYNFF